jgi:flavin reductase (DIM6/NTAB) family NADH-FMN oxidoreductase RutF
MLVNDASVRDQALAPPADLAEQFRRVMRQMAGTVTLITTELDGSNYGMAATSVTSLSMAPASVVFCVNKTASIYEPLLARGVACINVLSEHNAHLCPIFSGKEKGEQRFKYGDWRLGAERIYFLEDALAHFFIKTEQVGFFGTHGVFIGSVMRTCVDAARKPLVYLDGGYLTASRG